MSDKQSDLREVRFLPEYRVDGSHAIGHDRVTIKKDPGCRRGERVEVSINGSSAFVRGATLVRAVKLAMTGGNDE